MANILGLLELRRGPTADRMQKVLLSGEPGWDTDLKQLYVGDGITSGGVLVGGLDDPRIAELYAYLQQETADRIDGDNLLRSIIDGLATVAHSGNYIDLNNRPDTLSGFGITDAVNKFSSFKNGDIVTLEVGQAVAIDSNGSIVRVTDFTSAKNFIGFTKNRMEVGVSGLVQLAGTINNSISEWMNVIGTGLMVRSSYYLTNDGKITNVLPSTGFIKRVGIALSQTELKLVDQHIIKLD